MKTRLAPVALALTLLSPSARAQDETPATRVTGFVQASYAVSTRDVGRQIVGNLYLPRHDEFLFNAAMLKVERPAPSDRPGSGFVIEAMAGDHAAVVRAAGLDLGTHADVVQAYGVFALPARAFQLSVGKMATMLGNEVIESASNPNLSVGYQYVFLEDFTDTGVDLLWTGTSGWSARARVVNGWDVVTDNNEEKTVFAKVGWSGASRGIALFGYTGSELPDSVGGQRSGVELLANAKIGSLSATLQLDAGREEALDADWSGAGLWVVAPLRSTLDLALRADVIDDPEGVRTSGALGFPSHDGQTVAAATATLNYRPASGIALRPEVRYDHSSIPVFDGTREQWTVALGAAVSF